MIRNKGITNTKYYIMSMLLSYIILLFLFPIRSNAEIKLPKITEKNTVVILATGGTIAGSGEQGKETGYEAGTLSVESLVQAVPGLENVANIKAIQICNINSDDMTSEIWLDLVKCINTLAKDDNVVGFVVTHGTDTMEETAYFLNLTVKTDKPVVITGAMRPATSISADGPMNLYQAVCVAADDEARGKGVLGVFSDHIYTARALEKISTYDVTAIAAGEMGCVGIIRDNKTYFYESSLKKHTLESEFSVEEVKELPKVSIVYFAVDMDSDLLEYASKHSDGLVIAGAGAGEYSQAYENIIKSLEIPVVVSSRIDDGIITQDAVTCSNTIAANNLSPQKAAILLRLALLNTTNQKELIRIFDEY